MNKESIFQIFDDFEFCEEALFCGTYSFVQRCIENNKKFKELVLLMRDDSIQTLSYEKVKKILKFTNLNGIQLRMADISVVGLLLALSEMNYDKTREFAKKLSWEHPLIKWSWTKHFISINCGIDFISGSTSGVYSWLNKLIAQHSLILRCNGNNTDPILRIYVSDTGAGTEFVQNEKLFGTHIPAIHVNSWTKQNLYYLKNWLSTIMIDDLIRDKTYQIQANIATNCWKKFDAISL